MRLFSFLSFLLFSCFVYGQQTPGTYTEMWGMTSEGGTGNAGTIFKMNQTGQGYEVFKHLSDSNDYVTPYTDLILASDGWMYGTTSGGGRYNRGVIYKIHPTNGGLMPLHHFIDSSGSTLGGNNRLMEYNGKLYGMTNRGGDGHGVIYELDAFGTKNYKVLHKFAIAKGNNPKGALIEVSGKLYGMTFSGGTSSAGTIFEIDPTITNSHTVIHNFSTTNGSFPQADLTYLGGKFYGVAQAGGTNGDGVLFEVDYFGSGGYSVKHHFASATSGKAPKGNLTELNGKLYGLTTRGGDNDGGTLFEFSLSNNLITVKMHAGDITFSFKGSLAKKNNSLFGIEYAVFKYDLSSDTYSYLNDLSGEHNHCNGNPLIIGDDLYISFNKGDYAFPTHGNILRYDIQNDILSTFHGFSPLFDGAEPYGSLAHFDSTLYGMTNGGGHNNYGALFKINPTASGTFEVIHHFRKGYGNNIDNGYSPYGDLVSLNNKLYGMNYLGGNDNQGVIFEYDTSGTGTYTGRHHFNNTLGGHPKGSLLAYNGKLYGMTESGGISEKGVIFEYDPSGSGTYIVLNFFGGLSGEKPTFSSLIQSGGKLYGITSLGGSNFSGVLFELDLNGNVYSVLHHFNSNSGARPTGSLIKVNNKLYGMTSIGHKIFSFDINTNTYQVIKTLTSTAGYIPYGSLRYLDGFLYGMAYRGGQYDQGTIFKTDTTVQGAIDVLHHFSGNPDGRNPYGDLISFQKPCSLTKSYAILPDSCSVGSNGSITLSETSSLLGPFKYSIDGGTTFDTSSVFNNLEAGTYYLQAQDDYTGCISTIDTVVVAQAPDLALPVLTCQSAQNISTDANSCTAVATLNNPTGTDNCGITTPNYTPNASGISFTAVGADAWTATLPLGTTLVTFSGTDDNGNTGTCSQSITVSDIELPNLSCPSNQNKATNVAACVASVTFQNPSIVDNCGAASPNFSASASGGVALNHNAGSYSSLFPKGFTTVTFTGMDDNGNNGTCSFTVTVTDTQYPTISGCPSTMSLTADNGLCTTVPNWSTPIADDNCPNLQLTGSHSPSAPMPVGNNLVSYTATDGAGLQATCSFHVVVSDNQSPTLTCTSDRTAATKATTCNNTLAINFPTATDNCSITNPNYMPSAPGLTFTFVNNKWRTAFPLGTTVVTYTGTDDHGNTGTCTVNVTIFDNVKPILYCPANQIISTEPDLCGSTRSLTTPSITDNCGVSTPNFSTSNNGSVTLTESGGVYSGFFPKGQTTVSFSATDDNGNIGTCSTTITINDTQLPALANCPSSMALSTTPGLCSVVPNWTPPIATDNCPGVVRTSTHLPTSNFGIGTTTVRYFATDASNNKSTCTFNVTVTDNEAPVLTCAPNQTHSNSFNDCSKLAAFAGPTITDNCGANSSFSYSTSLATVFPLGGGSYLGQFPVGANVVTFTGSDVNGNTSTCSTVITIDDTQVPVLTNCPPNQILDGGSSASAVATWIAPTASDNCPGVGIIGSHQSGAVFPQGINTVVYTAMDIAGLSTGCSFTIEVTGNSQTWFADIDGDGFGDAMMDSISATQPMNYVADSTDCDDANPTTHPNATELCNGIDDNCDGQIDEGLTTNYYIDLDMDGFGDASGTAIAACSAPMNYVPNNIDCDDSNPALNPTANEICNGIDDNCDGQIDENVPCTKPLNLVFTDIDATNAVARWMPSCGATKYYIRYRPVGNVYNWYVIHNAVTTDSLVMNNLCFNTMYKFQIRARCNGAWTSWVSGTFTTANNPTCTNPYFTNVTKTQNSVSLTWIDIQGESNQRIHWREKGIASTLQSFNVSTNQNTYTINGLNANTEYEYRIKVRCNGIWFPYTPWTIVKTLTAPLAPPTNPRSLAEDGENLYLEINPNPSTGRIEVKNNLKGLKTYTLLNLQGRNLIEWSNQTEKAQLDLSDLPPGLYFLQLKNEFGQVVKGKVLLL